MKREEKDIIINDLVELFKNTEHFYIADISELDGEQTSNLRRACFQKEIKLMVVKNTLLKRALEQSNFEVEELYEVLKGPTSVMFTHTGNQPAKLIKEFRKKLDKPVLKGAFVEEGIYIGDDQLDTLSDIKSKEELIAELIGLLQSPMKNVVSSLQSGKNILAGVLETLSDKKE